MLDTMEIMFVIFLIIFVAFLLRTTVKICFMDPATFTHTTTAPVRRCNQNEGRPRIFTIDDPINADFTDFYYLERATNEKIDKDLPTYDEVMEMERERYQSSSSSPPYSETILQLTPQETSNIVPSTSVSTITTATTTISTGSSTISHIPR